MPKDKIMPLKTLEPEANQEIVAMIEQMLEEAKRGKIRSFAAACIRTSEETSYAMHADYRPIQLMGECTYLAMRIREKHVDPPPANNDMDNWK